MSPKMRLISAYAVFNILLSTCCNAFTARFLLIVSPSSKTKTISNRYKTPSSQKINYFALGSSADPEENYNNSKENDSPFPIPSLTEGIKIQNTERAILTHVKLVDASLRSLTGQGVTERMGLDNLTSPPDIYRSIYNNNRYILITHGTEENPIFNFGNQAALSAFYRSWESLTAMASAQSVVLRSIDEEMRIELMRKVTTENYVEGASGIRIRGDGTFIKLIDAVVWNCFNEDGTVIGQAAFFDRYKCPIIKTVEDA